MRLTRTCDTGLVAVLLMLFTAAVPGARQTENVSSSMVRIDAAATGEQGSGIVVGFQGEDAIVLTAYHVIAGASQFTVTFAGTPGARRFNVATASDLVGWQNTDVEFGLAVFRVRGVPRQEIHVAPLGSSSGLRPGDGLVYLGFPGRAATLRQLAGNVSALQGTSVVMDRSVSEGGSGGAIVKDGQVVGIAAGRQAADLTYAVGVDVVRLALRGWSVDVGSGRDQPKPKSEPRADRQEGMDVKDIQTSLMPTMFLGGEVEVTLEGHDPRRGLMFRGAVNYDRLNSVGFLVFVTPQTPIAQLGDSPYEISLIQVFDRQRVRVGIRRLK